MNIDELTIGQMKNIRKMGTCSAEFTPYEIGKAYMFRTVTHINIGVVKHVGEQEIIISDASWIADTGRFHTCLKQGIEEIPESEIEPFINDVGIGRGAIVDYTEWTHDLPKKQK